MTRRLLAFTFLFPLSFAQVVTVEQPSFAATCAEVNLVWEGGTAPWTVSILSAVSGTVLETVGTTSVVPPLAWLVDLAPGTPIVVQVSDAAANVGESNAFQIIPSDSGNICTQAGNFTSPSQHGPPKSKSTSSTVSTTANSNTITTSPPATTSSSTTTSTFPSSSSSLSTSSSPILPVTGASPPAIEILPTSSGSGTPNSSNDRTDAASGKSNIVKTPAFIAAIAGGGSVLALIVGFLLVQRCKRRRRRARESIFYPFDSSPDHKSNSSREMHGRAGYPASAFSSWGNHGDLAMEEQLQMQAGQRGVVPSPIPPLSASAEGLVNATTPTDYSNVEPWDGGHANTLEQVYDGYGAYTTQPQPYLTTYAPPSASLGMMSSKGAPPGMPGPMVSSSSSTAAFAAKHGGHGHSTSIDISVQPASEPGSPARPGQRFRGQQAAAVPVNKAMVEAYRAGLAGAPSAPDPQAPAYYADSPAQHPYPPPTPKSPDEPMLRKLLPQPVVNYPPPYTSS